MSFTGTYKVESRENLDEFLKATGATPEQIATVKAMTAVETITQDGDNFCIERKLPKKTISNKFQLGKACKLTTMKGNEMDATVTCEGGKLIARADNFEQITELCGDTLTETITANGVTMKRISKRQ